MISAKTAFKMINPALKKNNNSFLTQNEPNLIALLLGLLIGEA